LLRARRRRPVLLSEVDIEPAPAVSAEEETVWVDQIGRALLIVLDQLTPDQRAAYVLHDLFAVPFSDVAAVLDRSPASAKKLCSRARQRIHPSPTARDDAETTTRAAHRDLVEAFLDASRNGNISTLLELLAPDAIRLADPTLIPAHIAPRISSATAIAEETTIFAARARVGAVVLIDGAPAIAIAPNGHLAAAILIDIANGHIRALSVLPAHKVAGHSITLADAAGTV
ncbi:MAG: RNA polymerase subunit sigma, partial [Aldersonia sp.]|nr:RNA polymerase subunit sigma [Aldersonia sp.]